VTPLSQRLNNHDPVPGVAVRPAKRRSRKSVFE